MDSITPAQQIVAVVYEELARLMGEGPSGLAISPKPPTVYMLVGLQGSGKTTTAAKLAKRLSKGHRPLLVACDLKRPAAVEQLRILSEQVKVPFFGPGEGRETPLAVAAAIDLRGPGAGRPQWLAPLCADNSLAWPEDSRDE